MSTKHHKLHRHKDKHSPKSRNHRHHKKEHVSQTQSNPIDEVSKEKVRADKNACGDYNVYLPTINSKLEENITKKISKRKRNRSDIDKQKDKINCFEKNYAKEKEEIKKPKSIRHQSLEKNDDCLLERTKLLFRKEKSFNDALKKVTDLEKESRNKNIYKKIKGKLNVPPENGNKLKPIEPQFTNNPLQSDVRNNNSKKKHKSKDRSPYLDMYGRVQEVLFCQINKVPHKIRNDKKASEITDLYRRTKTERNSKEHKGVRLSQVQQLPKNEKQKCDPDEENLSPAANQLINSSSKYNERATPVTHHAELSKKKQCSERTEGILQKSESKTPKKRYRNKIPGQIEPEKYFKLEEEHYKYNRKLHKDTNIIKCLKDKQEKKHQTQKEYKQIKGCEEKQQQQAQLEGEKIQQIVEGNLKNYFCKIQTMIDNKLEAILQNNKRIFEERKVEKEKLRNQKRSRSKTKEKTADRIVEKQEQVKCFEQIGDVTLVKEEIINEVLNRLRRKKLHKLEAEEKDRKIKSEIKSSASKVTSENTFVPRPNKNCDNSLESKQLHTIYSPKESLSDRNIYRDVVEHHKQSSCHHPHKADRGLKEHRHQGHRSPARKCQHTELFSKTLFSAKDSLEYIRNNIEAKSPKLKERAQELIKSDSHSEFFSDNKEIDMILSQNSVQRESYFPKKHRTKMYSDNNNSERENFETRPTLVKRFSPDLSYKRCLGDTSFQRFDKGTKSYLEEIILTRESSNNCPNDILLKADAGQNLQKANFIVQGIEPPISQSIRKKSAPVRKLECKTVSVISILPQIREIESPLVNETQASSKSRKSSVTDRDLEEKKKKSKRKYPNNVDKPNVGSSDIRSIIASDSQIIVSGLSAEEIVPRYNKEKRPSISSEIHQINPSVLQNYTNDTLDSKQQENYFVPVRETHKEYYCRSLKSSHSNYCFKIEKKAANSYISVQSKEACDGKWMYYKEAKSRCYKSSTFSKSDIDLVSTVEGNCVIKSKSDVHVNRNKKNQEILKDSQKSKPFSEVKARLNEKSLIKTSCKECQTEEISTNGAQVVIANTQQQFQEIYNTIDILEKNIHNTKEGPQNTVDAAVSSMALNFVSKQNRFDMISNPRDPLEGTATGNEAIKKTDAAVGSPRSSRQSGRTKKIIPTRQIHDVAVGDSKVKLATKTPKLKLSRFQSNEDKHLKSSTAYQIRTRNPLTQDPTEGLQKEVSTPSPKPFVAGFSVQKRSKQTPETSPMRSQIPALLELTKQKRCVSMERAANRLYASSATRSRPQPKELSQRAGKDVCHQEKSKPVVTAANENILCSSNSMEGIPKTYPGFSCLHDCLHKTPKHSKILKTNTEPLMVNSATCKNRLRIQANSLSMTSSISDAIISQTAGTSDSFLEFKEHLGSPVYGIYSVQKAIQHDHNIDTKEDSVISDNMEKFANVPNLRRAGTTMDQYVGCKFASRLFLTKDFKGRKISAYQRRKLYDQSLRQQMKKNVRLPKVNVGPQIFEVRFLSMVNQEEEQQKGDNRITNPLISINFGGIIDDNSVSGQADTDAFKQTGERLSEIHVQNSDSSKSNHLMKTVNEMDAILDTNNKTCAFKEKKNTQIEREVNGNTPQEQLSQFFKHFPNNCSTYSNILNLIEMLNSVVAKYCSSDINTNKHIDISSTDLGEIVATATVSDSPKLFQADPQEKTVEIEEIFSASRKKVSSDSGQIILEAADYTDSPVLIEPWSCPTLVTHSTSFEFLYEETSSSNGDVDSGDVLANLTKPFNQTFTLNTSQYNVETPFIRTRNYESATASTESGYASIKSNSLSNFFKKPNIAALLKPTVAIKNSKRDGKNMFYEEMARSCQLYAKKVRQISQTKWDNNNGAGYQEFSLQVLLGKGSSIVLQSEAMGGNNLNEANFIQQPCYQTPDAASIQEENVISSKESKLSHSQNGYKLIFNNECLRTESIAYLGPEIFINDEASTDVKESTNSLSDNNDNVNLRVEASSLTFDFSMASNNNPFIANNDSQTRIFFTSLIQTYKRELEICDKLYQDDTFENLLLAAVNEGKKKRKSRFCKLFSKKTRKAERNIEKSKRDEEVVLEKKASSRLQSLALEAKKYFKMLADAVKVNENIDKEVKICGFLKLLERIESGDFRIMENDGEVNLEEEIRCQVTEAFINIYELCRKEAKKFKRNITRVEIKLIIAFVIKYRICLLSKTDIVARYISRGIIQTEDQLKAAVTFLIRSQSEEMDIKEFEEYCKFPK